MLGGLVTNLPRMSRVRTFLGALALLVVPLPAAAQDAQEPIFDVHLHAYSDLSLFEAAGSYDFGAHRRTAGQAVTDPKVVRRQTLQYMDSVGIRRGLVSGSAALGWAQAHPSRFLASFRPRPKESIEEAVNRFKRGLAEGRWHAVGELVLPYHGRPLNDSTLFPLYAAAEEAGVPVFFHTGLNGPAPGQLTGGAYRVELGNPLLLRNIVRRFPELDVVMMHMGWPFFDEGLYMMYAHPNVYMDVAVTNWILGRRHFERMLCEVESTVGTDRVLFGSDQMAWPQMIPRAVEAVRETDCLSEKDRRKIFRENAVELLDLNGISP